MSMEITLGKNQRVTAHYKGKELLTDQPEKAGGDNEALAPFDLFMASIGTCAGWYVKSFCQQRNLPEEGIKLTQKAKFNKEKGLIDNIEIEIHLPEDFPEKYRTPLIKAAGACTVKKHIMDAPDFSIVTSK